MPLSEKLADRVSVTDRIAQNGEAVNTDTSKSNTNVTNEEYKIRDVQVDTEEKAKKTAREPRTEYDTASFSSYADYLAQRIDALDAENEKLRKGRGILEKMAAVIGDVHVDALDVAEYAGEVKEQTGTHMTKREIASRIEDIYTRIAHSGADDDGSAAYTELFAGIALISWLKKIF